MSLIDDLSKKAIKNLKKKPQPKWTKPMLATLTHDYFSDEDWIYERKLDGERCLVFKKGKQIRLMSRNKKKLNSTYPELVDSLEKGTPKSFIADGEIVAFKNGITSFSRLQERMKIRQPEDARKQKIQVYYYLFDILFFDGYDVTKLALRHRKKILKKLSIYNKPIRYLKYRNKEGEKYHEEACKKGWEGIIAKEAASKYNHSRSKKWLKFKCVNRQELVIGGYTEPDGDRIGFGALLVGYYKDDDLRYAGKVGTGYDDETLKRLHKKMKALERKSSPFEKEKISEKNVHWITPKLVAEIGFTEWTEDNKLRHPRYVGLRRDKKARDVTMERVN